MDNGQRNELYTRLVRLIPPQMAKVIMAIQMPQEDQPPSGAPAAERAMLIVAWAGQNSDRLSALQAAVDEQTGTKEPGKAAPTPPSTEFQLPPALSVARYSELQQRARQANQRLLQLAEKLKIQSMAARGRRFADTLNAGPYRVVVIGKSRAGKSTLLNTLLGRDLCPVQSELTTAVPVVVEPGTPERARVRYRGGQVKDLDGPLSSAALAPYVDQAHNSENHKGIEEIRVWLANQSPDLGIAFVDVPGFDDPSNAIWPAVKKELEGAHALILVVDVSTARTGGLALDRYTIDHLKGAVLRRTPVFIIGSKADCLDGEAGRASAIDRIRRQLAQRQLESPLLRGPILLESENARAAQVAGQTLPSSFNEFLSALWRQLWETKGIGLRRLYATFQQIQQTNQEMETLFQVRVADEPKRKAIGAALEACEQQVAALSERVDKEITEISARVQARVEAAFQKVALQADALIRRKANGAIPKVSEVSDPLWEHARLAFDEVAAAVQEDFTHRMGLVEKALKRCLTTFRKEVGRHEVVDEVEASLGNLPAWQQVVGGPTDHVLDGRMIAGAIAGGVGLIAVALTGPFGLLLGAIAGGIVELFTNHPDSIEELRTKVMRRLRNDFDGLQATVEHKLASLAPDLKERVLDGAEPFLADVANYLNDNRSPTAEEIRLHGLVVNEVRSAVAVLVQAFDNDRPAGAPN